jgi:uncharacterized protein (DUF305 family)
MTTSGAGSQPERDEDSEYEYGSAADLDLDGDEADSPRPPPRPLALRIAAAMLAGGLCLAGGYALAKDGSDIPSDTSAAAGFARDMQSHHSQAVRMSMIIRDRTDDERVRTLAYDIALTQQQQIGQMYGWLDQWELPQVPPGPPLAWMGGAAGHGHGGTGVPPPESGAATGPSPSSSEQAAAGPEGMPGMATITQLRELERAKGRAAEVLYLRLMITHHLAGVSMAREALIRTDNPQVRRLADSMVAGQNNEVNLMRDMLRLREQR